MKMLRLFLVLQLLFATSAALIERDNRKFSFNQRVKRSDDVSLASLQTVLEQHASLIQTLQAELAATRTQLSATTVRVKQLETTVQQQHTQIQLASKAVSFSARFPHAGDNNDNGFSLGAHQTLVFTDVVTNVGQAYSATTGVFTAPVAGTYAFFLSQMAPNAQSQLFLSVVKNGAVIDEVFSEGPGDQFDQGSSLVTIHLAPGDQVWVRQEAGTGVRGSYWTIFSGFLLHADP